MYHPDYGLDFRTVNYHPTWNHLQCTDMTPRERILTALSHQPPDHTPTDGWFHREVIDSLKRHFNTNDWPAVLGELGIEGWAELGPQLVPADPSVKFTVSSSHSSGQPAVWIDETTYEDIWGVRFRVGTGGRYRQWLSGPLENARTPDDVARFAMLGFDEIRQPHSYPQQIARLQADGNFVFANIENPFRRLWNLRGYENALIDYRANTELLETIYDSLYELFTEMATRAVRAGVDMIRIVGDIAMQDRIIMGPALWRSFDKPRMADLVGSCRAIDPDLAVFFHSDGKLTELLDDLVEIGFNVINPIQPECMDPVEVKRRWGKKITLHGCISIQQTLPFGTVDAVRREVEELIRQCGYDGGLVLMPSNNIQPDTPIENILACYHAARDFDVPALGGRAG